MSYWRPALQNITFTICAYRPILSIITYEKGLSPLSRALTCMFQRLILHKIRKNIFFFSFNDIYTREILYKN